MRATAKSEVWKWGPKKSTRWGEWGKHLAKQCAESPKLYCMDSPATQDCLFKLNNLLSFPRI